MRRSPGTNRPPSLPRFPHIEVKDLPADTFVVPAGYTKGKDIEMPPNPLIRRGASRPRARCVRSACGRCVRRARCALMRLELAGAPWERLRAAIGR